MTNSYIALWRKLGLATLLGLGSVATTQAQFLNYPTSLAVNTAGTYTDLGATGTAIAVANNDNAISSPQSIGFTFLYDGVAYSNFVLSTNGFIKLGVNAPSSNMLLNAIGSGNDLDKDIIAAISNLDLYGAADQTANPTGFRVATTGTAPNRVCTIQFKNLRDYSSPGPPVVPAQFATMQFQIRLFEGTNNIELVYGTWTATTGTATGQPAVIGLKGSSIAASDRVLALKPASATPWTATTFDQPAALQAHFMRNTFLPDPGRTYRFVAGPPLPANDAAAQVIYSLGKAPVASPQVVQAVVRNAGSAALTNLNVTLNVTGANTFTNTKVVPSLAAGASATVSFNAFTPTTTGNNTLTVTVPADAVPGNNSKAYTQVVTANTFSYANNATPDPAGSVGFGPTTTGALIAKFNTPVARTVSAVGVWLEGGANTVGRTVYGVAVNAAGAVLARSADYVVQTADIGRTKSFVFNTPVSVAAGDFYVGMVQTAAPAGGSGYFPVATLPESPTRSGAFFTIAPFTAAGGTLSDAAVSNLGAFVIDAQTAVVLGTSKALNRAVWMYPNPSTGLVKLEVRGANAKDNLQVNVVNMLGQQVYTTSLKDNFINEVNLSSLANGMYLLKVQTGNEFTTRQLTIAK
ncbi:T9SS type A sorting domain-containing protein [Hymenobacter sp. BT664]|uniref:T9SS type A sorting domain-containing protein n=1 Tax=Hymenobacter montanus TaxID=2771359 RepID=A0A927BHG1_9BACT|nr:T9SS type A sorting domain-containing protein [Hymenobacter montanus]MBD2769978.1 T9SS type A sorting domain-containing protein [Hymenobacter montanus]